MQHRNTQKGYSIGVAFLCIAIYMPDVIRIPWTLQVRFLCN